MNNLQHGYTGNVMTTPQHINLLVHDVHQNAIDHGFWDKSQNVGEKVALACGELAGEFLESYRTDDLRPDEHCPDFTNQTIELADTVIRSLDIAGWLHIYNLGDAIAAKMDTTAPDQSFTGRNFNTEDLYGQTIPRV